MKRKFWNWIKNDVGGEEERTLVLNGEISDETWYGDEVTPALFAKELNAGSGNITVWINSPGGDVFAAAQIYNMLMEYKGDVTVKVDALAALAASVIAMAGTTVLMSPVAVELGFADGILHGEEDTEDVAGEKELEGLMFSRTAVTNSLLTKLIPKKPKAKVPIR